MSELIWNRVTVFADDDTISKVFSELKRQDYGYRVVEEEPHQANQVIIETHYSDIEYEVKELSERYPNATFCLYWASEVYEFRRGWWRFKKGEELDCDFDYDEEDEPREEWNKPFTPPSTSQSLYGWPHL